MFALSLAVALAWWAQGSASAPLEYTLTLKEAQGLTLCAYKLDVNVKNDRLPRAIEIVRCLSCGKECNPYGKTTTSCMQVTTTHYVTYLSTGMSRNETYPVACVCVHRHPNKGYFEQISLQNDGSRQDEVSSPVSQPVQKTNNMSLNEGQPSESFEPKL